MFPSDEDVQYYERMARKGVAGEVLDPFIWSIQEAVADFAAAGVELLSTGQTRGDLYSLFLDRRFVKGITWKGAEAYVSDKIERVSNIRLADIQLARSILPSHLKLKEPVTDAYTLARFAKISTPTYRDTRDLANDINRLIVIPELEDMQKSGAVEMIQLDSPNLAAESSTPEFLSSLYEEVTSAAKVPLVMHVCGDTMRIFKLLVTLKVDALELDFFHYPRLLDEVSRKNFDQTIGLGVLDAQSPRVETVEEVAELIGRCKKALGEDKIRYVHPHCGQRSLNREIAFQKNANMTMARDDVYFGEAEEPRSVRLEKRQYDPKGYFLVTVNRERNELVVTFYTYRHTVVKRYRSRFADRLLQAINLDADSLGISRRHLAYLTLELGRADASLQYPSLLYRQRMIE